VALKLCRRDLEAPDFEKFLNTLSGQYMMSWRRFACSDLQPVDDKHVAILVNLDNVSSLDPDVMSELVGMHAILHLPSVLKCFLCAASER